MQVIEEGEFFEINTEERQEAAKTVLKKLRETGTWRKGNAAQRLYEDEVYKQKQDCKDFIKNLIRSENFEVVSVGRSEIGLTGRRKVIQ